MGTSPPTGQATMPQRDLFEVIFSDAHLVDIDLSGWDKRIALYVLADHAGRTVDNRLPLFIVEFYRVWHWDLRFNHLLHDPPIVLEPDEHVQWLLDDFFIEPDERGIRITLWGTSTSPRMTFLCEGVRIREMPLDVPDSLFPGWVRPSRGFIRPGLDALARNL